MTDLFLVRVVSPARIKYVAQSWEYLYDRWASSDGDCGTGGSACFYIFAHQNINFYWPSLFSLQTKQMSMHFQEVLIEDILLKSPCGKVKILFFFIFDFFDSFFKAFRMHFLYLRGILTLIVLLDVISFKIIPYLTFALT